MKTAVGTVTCHRRQSSFQIQSWPADDFHWFWHRYATNSKAAAYFLRQACAVVCNDVMGLLRKLTRWTDDQTCVMRGQMMTSLQCTLLSSNKTW